MAIIRATCPTCGDVDMEPGEVTLRLEESGDSAAFAFTCPVCLATVRKRASRRTIATLEAAGVDLIGPDWPAEALDLPGPALGPEDRSPDPDAPAFTFDDLIEFHFLLEDDAALRRLPDRGRRRLSR